MAAGFLKVTYRKSVIGHPQDQRATLRSLGLKRLNQSVVVPDTPVTRGMIAKVRHLVVVEETAAESGPENPARAAAKKAGAAR
ncbi:MAG: 50S ribosomal protein L30 [Bacillota bacterium]